MDFRRETTHDLIQFVIETLVQQHNALTGETINDDDFSVGLVLVGDNEQDAKHVFELLFAVYLFIKDRNGEHRERTIGVTALMEMFAKGIRGMIFKPDENRFHVIRTTGTDEMIKLNRQFEPGYEPNNPN